LSVKAPPGQNEIGNKVWQNRHSWPAAMQPIDSIRLHPKTSATRARSAWIISHAVLSLPSFVAQEID